MGTDYYLIRPDNGTLYDLGKIGTFRRTLGGDGRIPAPFIALPSDDAGLERLAINLKLDWDAAYTEPAGIEYFQALARDICRWAGGMPVRFASEHDGQLDAWADDDPTASGAASAEEKTRTLQRALIRLLWSSVADDADCTCAITDICPECEAMAALGLGRWHNATAADYALGAMEQGLKKAAL